MQTFAIALHANHYRTLVGDWPARSYQIELLPMNRLVWLFRPMPLQMPINLQHGRSRMCKLSMFLFFFTATWTNRTSNYYNKARNSRWTTTPSSHNTKQLLVKLTYLSTSQGHELVWSPFLFHFGQTTQQTQETHFWLSWNWMTSSLQQGLRLLTVSIHTILTVRSNVSSR